MAISFTRASALALLGVASFAAPGCKDGDAPYLMLTSDQRLDPGDEATLHLRAENRSSDPQALRVRASGVGGVQIVRATGGSCPSGVASGCSGTDFSVSEVLLGDTVPARTNFTYEIVVRCPDHPTTERVTATMTVLTSEVTIQCGAPDAGTPADAGGACAEDENPCTEARVFGEGECGFELRECPPRSQCDSESGECAPHSSAIGTRIGIEQAVIDTWMDSGEIYKQYRVILGIPNSVPGISATDGNPRFLIGLLDPVLQLAPAATTRVFDMALPCDATLPDGGFVVCASTDPPPAGEWVFLLSVYSAPLSLDPSLHHQLAYVFEDDGDPSNDYVPSPEYPNDFFQDTDLWYELLHDPATGWSVRVRDVRLGLADVPSHARFVVQGDEVAILVPRSELGASPTFRSTLFSHDGGFGLDGGFWTGDYRPRLGEPLARAAVGEVVPIEM